MRLQFEMVPPPVKAPVQPLAASLDLVQGLRVEKSGHSQWRCSCCSQMQKPGSLQVWVPDSVCRGDPEWSVTEACRENAYNGFHSGWCIKCAPKAGKRHRAKDVCRSAAPSFVNYAKTRSLPVLLGLTHVETLRAIWGGNGFFLWLLNSAFGIAALVSVLVFAVVIAAIGFVGDYK